MARASAWTFGDHFGLRERERPIRPTRPSMVMPGAGGVHAEPAVPARRPAFPQGGIIRGSSGVRSRALPLQTGPRRRLQSWGINCAQIAIVPTKSVIDASAAASSTNVFNMVTS